ncbi:MAG: DUF4177 domain-containing protein [Rhodobacteraceae bacterium]|nr:MAG: DUF4177 domain-containing protein [Paracoccaceae bacterium]
MSTFEYKTICAPRKALKIKGVKGTDNRYAQTLTDAINAQAADGWEYFRAESLPVDEKTGMMGKTEEKYLSLLIFRRENIETYEEPAFSPAAAEEAADPMMLQTPEVEDVAEIEIDGEISDEISTLGPATR